MYRLFSRSTPTGYLLLLVLIVALRLRLIMNPAYYVVADTPDMYSPFWTALMGHVEAGSMLSVILALVSMALVTLMVNNIVNRFGLLPVQSCLGGLLFVILSGGLRPSIGFQPVTLYAVAFAWSIDRLFSATRKDRPYLSIAWGFAIATFGALLWGKGVWFLPFLFVGLGLLRLGGLRRLMAALMGVGSVVLIGATVVLYSDEPLEMLRAYGRSAVTTLPYWRVGAVSITYLSIVVALVVIGALSLQRHLLEVKIAESRRLRFAEWTVFFVILLMLMPCFSYEIQQLAAIGAAMYLPSFFYGLRSVVAKEVSLGILLLMTVIIIF